MPTTPRPPDDRNRSPAGADPQSAANELTQPYQQTDPVETPPFQGDASAGTNDLSAADTPTASYSAENEPLRPAKAALPEIAGYEVLRRVARGGMGEVLEARHLVLNRTVAIKMPLPHVIASEDDQERFLREARTAAQLRHPQICAIHEVGQLDGRPFIVMDFIRGQTLRQWRTSREPTARQAAEWLAAVARAVEYAHRRGVIHRDLKPSNVLVDAESNSPVLTDFGLAKQLGDENSQLTQTGQVMGTPAYMAPEQAAGQLAAVGPCSDIYSLGAILYELLCGNPPFSGPTGSVLRQVQCDEPPIPRTINAKIHPDLETICLKAMAKEPTARYESAAAMADDLERFGAGEPILARRTGRVTRLWRQARRRPAVIASLAAAAAALLLAAGLAIHAGKSRQLAQLNQEFEAGLDATEFSDERLASLEMTASRLDLLSPGQGASARERLYRRFAERQHALLRRATLEDDALQRIERALQVLHDHAPELERPLRQAFAERQRAWETVLELPGSPLEAVFGGEVESAVGGYVVPSEDYGWRSLSRLVTTRIASPGNIELEALFDPSWRQSPEIGLAFNTLEDSSASQTASDLPPQAGADSGYVFRLRVDVKPPEYNVPEFQAPPPTFAAAGGKLQNLILEIARGGTRLAHRIVKPSALPDGPLRLFAGRTAERVWVQVNDQEPLVFQDIFPISRAQPGRFALLWPPKAKLSALRGRRQQPPVVSSALERGDELYSQQLFIEALEAYQSEQIASVGTAAAQEARFKASLCLAALERPEARQRLQELAVEAGDRWPVLAACRLWAEALRLQQFDEADAVLERLRGRYRFEQLAALIPAGLRAEILGQYEQQAIGFSLFKAAPNRIARMRSAVEVENLLGSLSHPHYTARLQLLRAFEVSGRLEEALSLAKEMVGQGGQWEREGATNWVDEYCWLLSLAGRGEEALTRVDQYLSGAYGDLPDSNRLLLARSRVLAGLGRWDEAEHDAERWFQSVADRESPIFVTGSLVRGLLRERRGDVAGSLEAWREGLSSVDFSELASKNGSVVVAALIMGSLSGEMSERQADSLSAQLIAAFSSGTPIGIMKDFVRVPPAVLQNMWRTDRGREAARQIAFRQVSMADHVRLPAVLLAVELAHQGAFGGQWNSEQEQVVWELMDASLQRYLQGSLSAPQLTSVGMTWKGVTNFLGWGGVADSLPPDYRAPLAYLFAHRFLALGKSEQAQEFLRVALRDSAADSAVRRLAAAKLADASKADEADQ
ncbi:MAG TPA: serine/threonine-protein kinase [Pirellulales bacterium]|nr:serine/threonine-protein kinase [Pirellulales bacterium]